MTYYLGIDGGGTKTRCLLGDETRPLAMATTGGSNIVRLGETQAREALLTSIHQVCSTVGISPDQISAICIGVAGASIPEVAAKIRGILTELMPQVSLTNIEVAGDNVIALEAAFAAGPGVIAIAGTGSLVYGRNAAGHTARAGGWGFAISDEGSGHWIGRHAISAILHARDEGLETALAAMVLQGWKLATIDDLVQHANSTPPPDFPRLFPVVLRAAEEGDAIARELLADAGAKLANLATAVVRRLTPHASREIGPMDLLPVAMTGSVFRQSADVRQVFYNTLQTNFPGIDVHQELADPVEGALARAKRR
ncbi:MAG TPA: BadF/BadG/BcrA/BcrD ATPase family protein [Terriglobales bacterium]|nr:BadF/BadG/BcrA/BcrD ATPase family protein [Terriglobales bacterium]